MLTAFVARIEATMVINGGNHCPVAERFWQFDGAIFGRSIRGLAS